MMSKAGTQMRAMSALLTYRVPAMICQTWFQVPRQMTPTTILLAAVVVLSACSGSSTSTPSSTSTTATSAAIAAPIGVHVIHPNAAGAYLADATGHTVLLRGVNDNALAEYAPDYPQAPSIGASDFTEMAALGMNFVRLQVSWSRIMPKPGEISQPYLDHVARVVSWARSNGVGVLVDMHEDNFSWQSYPGHEADGAPAWANLYDGTPCTPTASTTACSLAAFKNFWVNAPVAGKPIQSWYLQAMTAVAKAAGANSNSSNVVGVELMNEPWPSGPTPFETQSLYPFYNRMVSGLRRARIVTPIWFEPSLIRNVTDNAVAGAIHFSADQNLVYAVHIYTGVFSPPFNSTVSQAAIHTSYANAAVEAGAFGAPFVVDEYGSSATPEWNRWLSDQLNRQNAYQVGSSFWLWKQRPGKWDNWSTVQLDGSLRSTTLRAQTLSGPHVDTVPGTLLSATASTGSLTITTEGNGGHATAWGGSVVARGGPSATEATLRTVTAGGKTVPSTCRTVTFRTSTNHLSGCLLTFSIPAGHQLVELTP
jgi:endoglycosylceramidase